MIKRILLVCIFIVLSFVLIVVPAQAAAPNQADIPHLSLTKTVFPTTYSQIGDVLNYTLVATNDGNTTLFISFSDPGLDFPPTGIAPPTDPGHTFTFTGTHTITQADLVNGSFTNTATATGSYGNFQSVSASSSVTAIAATGTLEILKFNDINHNGSRQPNTEPVLADWGFTITGPNRYMSSGVTDASGLITLTNLVPGDYAVAEKYRPPENPGGAWYSTNGASKRVTVPAIGTMKLEFGNAYNPKVPASSDTSMFIMVGGFAILIGLLVFWRERRHLYQRR